MRRVCSGLITAFLLASFSEPSRAAQAADSVQLPERSFPSTSALPGRAETPFLESREKLLPEPEGIGGPFSEFGSGVAVDGDRLAIGGFQLAGAGRVVTMVYSNGGWLEEAVIGPSDDVDGAGFGWSVRLQGDRLIVGSPGERVGNARSGAAYVFERVGDSWLERARLEPSDGQGRDRFGYSVAIDGDRVVVGSPLHDELGPESGAVYVFDFDGTEWFQTSKLTGLDLEPNDFFGHAVAISGSKVLIGAEGASDLGENSGAAYIFFDDEFGWQQQAKLIDAGGAAGNLFGNSVDLDGSRAVVGSPVDRGTDGSVGSVQIYEFDGQTWAAGERLSAKPGSFSDLFGTAVDLQGQRLAVGARDDGGDSATYVFDFDGAVWAQSARLEQEFFYDNGFGADVSLDGSRVLVGAPWDDRRGRDSGTALLFEESAGGWLREHEFLSPSGAGGSALGESLAIEDDMIILGAPTWSTEIGRSFGIGSAYVFQQSGQSWVLLTELSADDGANGDEFGASVAVSEGQVMVGAPGDDHYQHSDTGAVYVFAQDEPDFFQQGKLRPNDYEEGDRFGTSIGVQGEWMLIGAPGDDDNGSASGSVYIYQRVGQEWMQHSKLLAPDSQSGDQFGVSISVDGDRALIGAAGDLPFFGIVDGAAYVFRRDAKVWALEDKLEPVDLDTQDNFGRAVSLFGDRALIGSPFDDDVGSFSGSAYLFERGGSEWVEVAKITPTNGVAGEQFGTSLFLTENQALVGASFNSELDTQSGAAYLFVRDGPTWNEVKSIRPLDSRVLDRFGATVAMRGPVLFVGAVGDDDHGPDSGSVYVIDDRIFVDQFEGLGQRN